MVCGQKTPRRKIGSIPTPKLLKNVASPCLVPLFDPKTNKQTITIAIAGIIGAYRPDAPELNGVAPGCQIISCKIGDSRLDSMESLPALIRVRTKHLTYGLFII